MVLYFHGCCFFFFSVTLEDLKQQADEFGLEGKDFLKEKWRKIQDAKLEKERFERKEKRLEKEAEQKGLEPEEKRFEKKIEEKTIRKGNERRTIRKRNETKTIRKRGGRKALKEGGYISCSLKSWLHNWSSKGYNSKERGWNAKTSKLERKSSSQHQVKLI